MASLIEVINQDLVRSQKAKNEIAVSSLRLLIADIHNVQIAKGGELSDAETREVIAKKAKRHKESIDAYEKGGRGDLVAKEKAELATVERYLPTQLSEQEISKVVDEVIASNGAKDGADMGKIIGAVMGRVRGQADGAKVSEIVKQRLTNQS